MRALCSFEAEGVGVRIESRQENDLPYQFNNLLAHNILDDAGGFYGWFCSFARDVHHLC